MATLYEYYNTGDDDHEGIDGAHWGGQTFTPLICHELRSVKIKVFRTNNPGTCTISIRLTDGAGLPTGIDLISDTFNANLLVNAPPGEWKEIFFPAPYISLLAGVKYAIIVRISGSTPDEMAWRTDTTFPTYPRGNTVISTDSGVSWANRPPGNPYDHMFEEWGNPCSIASIFGRYTMATRIARNAFSRMWLIENRAGPANPPSYEGLWKAGRPGWSLGDVTPIYIPSEMEYGHFDVAGKILGERGSPNLAVMARYKADALSTLLRLARLGCDHDLQVHFGDCADPQDFNGGWNKVLLLEGARPTEYSATELGALAPVDQSTVDEEVPFSGEALYEIVQIVYAEQAEEQALQRVIDIEVCDRISCGECGITSDGCQVVFAISTIIEGSPGLPVELLYTQNGGDDWADTTITSLAANQNPNAVDCVGPNVVVISEDTESLHWAPIVDILAGPEVWTPEGTGFVAGFGPLAIFSLDPRHTWIVGETGYVYFTDDPTIGVIVQDAGIATGQNLNAVHALDSLNVVAVGVANAVIVTRNGGETWAPLVGPVPLGGVNMTAVWMRGPNEWFVGASDGNLYYTVDGGENWVQKEFYLDTGGAVTDIKFSSPSVGWMSHIKDAVGRIFRTIDGGYSWYVTPEGNTALPTNLGIDALAVCENVNVIYGAGLAADDDGIIVKGEGT